MPLLATQSKWRMRRLPASRRGRVVGCAGAALLAATLVSGCAEAPRELGHGAEARPRQTPQPGPSPFLSRVRQLTFAGERSAQGTFSRDGSLLVFQSQRGAGNPFDQIYVMDLETGDVWRVSPAVGKTGRGAIHPGSGKVLFASTHWDPEVRSEPQAKRDAEAAGRPGRRHRDFDERYDLFSADLLPRLRVSGESSPAGGEATPDTAAAAEARLRRLTEARGYDGEASWSPDGHWIVFASNRDAYARGLSSEERALLERDPSHFVDIYIMDAGGQNLQRLTHAAGYDGGPSFSPDGGRIAWQRASEGGGAAEVFSMRTDGRDQHQLTRLGGQSGAPFYHPSGDYLIFATELPGFQSFELYLVDAAGRSDPVRVTHNQVSDGLPAFSPKGDALVWTRETEPGGATQLFLADWDDARAREALRLPSRRHGVVAPLLPLPESSAPSIEEDDLRAHVMALASETTEGRLAGSAGERIATSYVARAFRSMGLEPAGDNATYFQDFAFTAGGSPGEGGRPQRRQARNVLARLPADRPEDEGPPRPMIAIGAHVDHLGRRDTAGPLSLETRQLHPGADDNASGVAALLEIAQYLAYRRTQGILDTRRDILFAAWSAQELGQLGSQHFVDAITGGGERLSGKLAAYLNLDAVGRLDGKVSVLGANSSQLWPMEIEKHNLAIGLPIETRGDGHLLGDATPFALERIPFLGFTTGTHRDSRTPRDLPEKLDYRGLRDIARLAAAIARSAASR